MKKIKFLSLFLSMIITLSVFNIPEVSAASNYNYAKLLQMSLYFYDANMCGGEVASKSAFSFLVIVSSATSYHVLPVSYSFI